MTATRQCTCSVSSAFIILWFHLFRRDFRDANTRTSRTVRTPHAVLYQAEIYFAHSRRNTITMLSDLEISLCMNFYHPRYTCNTQNCVRGLGRATMDTQRMLQECGSHSSSPQVTFLSPRKVVVSQRHVVQI